jgi:large subunit ribosomal protein L11
MAKKIKAFVKLALPAGKASASPPVGPALGQHGVNIGAFIKDYNAKTSDKIGTIIPVKITIYQDKTYSYVLKSPPVSTLLVKKANIKKGSSKPNNYMVATLSRNDLKEIALLKLKDLNTKNIDCAISTIEGTAKGMGIKIEN